MPLRTSFLRRHSLLFSILLLLASILWMAYDHFLEDGNFDVIIPNTLYRSATLSQHEWKQISKTNPFKSVINLRGERPDDWYIREVQLSKQEGINFYTLGISANHQPDLVTTETLVEMMRAAPKPLLVHCKSGADRTGLALALYQYAIAGKSATEADKQLSIHYGHFPWLTSRTAAMDRAFAAYVAAHPQTSAN